MIVVGISGVARSGKNLLCELLMQNLYLEGYTSKPFALAADLKNDCDEFLYKKCDLNVWTDLTEDKTQFREFLVWYGSLKRKQTDGRYWIDKLDRRISTYEGDVAIVTDVRYDQYDKDEVHWIKEDEKEIFLTFSEVNQLELVRQAAIRQKYIDQTQSLNLSFDPTDSPKWINQCHLEAWKLGVKTLYYLRTDSVIKGDLGSRTADCIACDG